MSRDIVVGLFMLTGLAVVVVGWLAQRPGSTVPTLGEVSGFVMSYQVGAIPVGRIAVLGFWSWVGWHFFAR